MMLTVDLFESLNVTCGGTLHVLIYHHGSILLL
jgi:hypothetical protein